MSAHPRKKVIPAMSASRWLEYLNADSARRVTIVAELKNQHERDESGMDFWRAWRLELARIHKNDLGKEALEGLWVNSSEKQRRLYKLASEGYSKYWGRKKIVARAVANRGEQLWTENELRIRVGPDLTMIVGNQPPRHVLLHLSQKQPLSQAAANPLLAMMQASFGEDVEVGILDVHRGSLLTPTRGISQRLLTQITGDAASFVAMWKRDPREPRDDRN